MNKNQIQIIDQLNLSNLPISAWHGREFISNGKTYIDFASTNYLGFDFDPLLHERGTFFVRKYGNISGWSRMEVDPEIYKNLETKIGQLLKSERVHLAHTITLTNFSVIPGIVKNGMIFTDHYVHTVVWEACRLARDHGADIQRFRHQDMNHLEELLKQNRHITPKLIAVDGVYSNSTAIVPIKILQELCRYYDAWLYVDDAHGFGILGENPSKMNSYGYKGNGVVRFANGDYARTFYVSSFGKAFCAYSAFTTIPTEFQESLRAFSMQYLYSAPPNPYLIGTVDAVLELNDLRGNKERERIRYLVNYFTTGLKNLRLNFFNYLQQPVVFVHIGELHELIEAATLLHQMRVSPAIRVYPQVAPSQCGFRFAISSLHTESQIDQALQALSEIKNNKIQIAI